ncbi:MAG: 2OG-Fe(II) oxygenase [Thermosynechococcaceae cyanobacterium]
MSSITTDLPKILSTVQRPGDYYASGKTEIFMPHLEVEGVGPIALPLLPAQAEQLVSVAEQAPYGRGEDTIIDPAVRRTWQINADQIQIEGKHWQKDLESIVSSVAKGLGVNNGVKAELYKLLVYDEGCFFVDHRDTEKVNRMFATLVIVLPSLYSGGELLVRHLEDEVRLDLCCLDLSEVSFAAFYADCVHEVLPITSGCRLTLVYNLLRRGKGQLPEPPNYEAEQANVAELLQQWILDKELPNDTSPEKLIYPLEHAYTPAALAFDALKGADQAISSVLVPAAKQAECDIHLALVTIEESGDAEYTGYYGSRRRRKYWSDYDDDDEDPSNFEIGDVYDRSTTLTDWRRPDGKATTLGTSPFHDTELCPPDSFDGLEPDELYFQEAAGNEGASFERTYRRAALILWPKARRLAVFNQAGLSVTLPFLDEQIQQWLESGEESDSSLWQEAHELAGHMIRSWSREGAYSAKLGHTSQMLILLSQLQDIDLISTFLTEISAAGIYDQRDNKALIQAIKLLSSLQITELIENIISQNVFDSLSACGELLARTVEMAKGFASTVDLHPAATALVDGLPGAPSRHAKASPWRHHQPVQSDFVVDFLTALVQIDMTLADQAVEYMLAFPKTYDLDSVIIPAVLALTKRKSHRNNGAIQRLQAASLSHLGNRIAEPLEKPQDWTRDHTLTCNCAHCGELSLFLSAPDRQNWTFKASENSRRHVESSIRQSRCDLDFRTEKQGRPYSLICTKNQASYKRRAQQRKQDLEYISQLEQFA